MMKYSALASLVAGAALVLGCEANASQEETQPQGQMQQQEPQQQQGQHGQMSQHHGQMGKMGQQQPSQLGQMGQSGLPAAQVQGKVLQSKEVKVKTRQGEQVTAHEVILLETQAGNRVIVDLGPTDQLQGIQVDQGKQISIVGQPGRVADRGVLFAERVQAGDQTAQIQRPRQELQRRAQIQQQQRGIPEFEAQGPEQAEQKLTGRILQHKDVQIQGTGESNKVVLLKTEDGKAFVVDLGPNKNLQQVAVHRGTPIEVQGTLTRVGDRLVVMAKNLDIGEQKLDIRREQGQQQQGQQQQGQQQQGQQQQGQQQQGPQQQGQQQQPG